MTSHEILETARAGDLERLGVEREEVANAVRRFAEIGDAASALELISRTWRIWLSRGELDQGSSLVAAALATPRGSAAAPIWEMRALYADGLFAFRAGDQERSRASNEKALRIARETGDVRGECEAMTGLARVALRDGLYREVVALASQARERAIAGHDLEAEAPPLHLLAAGTRLERNYLAARGLYLESLRLNTELGKTAWVAMELHNLGWVELHLGNVTEAAARFHERDAATGPDAYGEAWTALNWSAIAAARGDVAEAQQRFATGARALERLGMRLDPDDASELEWLREQVRAES
jgi:tetratricopeptide (TPR) repeat protein